MKITLNMTTLYLLSAAVLAVTLGGGFGAYIFFENKGKEDAYQKEMRKINSAKNGYQQLKVSIEKKLSYALSEYNYAEREFSSLNLLGWVPVEFKCQSYLCEYTLSTDNRNYVGIPNVVSGYREMKSVMSENNLLISGIKLDENDRVLDESLYKKLPSCTESLSDMRKFIDISNFSLSGEKSSQVSSFTFQQPASLVKNKNWLNKGHIKYYDVYGIDWNVQGFDWMKMNYLSRYILSNENVGISAIRKLFDENGSVYSSTGTVYCKVN